MAATPDDELETLLWPRLTRYIPHRPTPPQQAFLLLDTIAALYGGAVAGGKSDALLMAALQYVDVPGYSALILRQSFAELDEPGALLDRADEWLAPTDARSRGGRRRWIFPSGANLTFGYFQHWRHRLRYASAEYQYIGIDEALDWPERHYRFMFSRLRRPAHAANLAAAPDGLTLADVPIRMRLGSNPGPGWVKQLYVDPRTRQDGHAFIPSRMTDNPYVDADTYRQGLAHLRPALRRQLEEGDWNAREPGPMFDRAWVSTAPRGTWHPRPLTAVPDLPPSDGSSSTD